MICRPYPPITKVFLIKTSFRYLWVQTFIKHCGWCPCLRRDRCQIGWRQGHWWLQVPIWWFISPKICSKTIKPRWQIQLRWWWTITNYLLRINHQIRILDPVRWPSPPLRSIRLVHSWSNDRKRQSFSYKSVQYYLSCGMIHALFKLFNRSQNKKVIQNKKLALLKSQEITFHGQSITNFLDKWPYFKATVTQLYIIWLIMTLTEAKAYDSKPDYPGIFQKTSKYLYKYSC